MQERSGTQENQDEKQLHEINEYQDTAFPIGIYIVTKKGITPDGRGYLDLHWHEELQLTLVTDGVLKIRVNAEDYILEKGQAIFINRNLLHITTELTDNGRYISLNFPDKMLGFFPGSRMEQDYVLPYTGNYAFPAVILKEEISWQGEILHELREILDIMEHGKPAGFEYMISLKLTTIWCDLITHMKNRVKTPSKSYIRKQERIQSMLSFIHEKYMKDIRLEDIASHANISVGECCRCFQSMVKKSPNQYLLDYRISKSIELLDRTELSVTEIAFAVGFNDSSYFIQRFKRNTGMTPKDYRAGI